jgi:hypothetical protein
MDRIGFEYTEIEMPVGFHLLVTSQLSKDELIYHIPILKKEPSEVNYLL